MDRENDIRALLDRGAERGCIDVSELGELVRRQELGDVEVEELEKRLENAGVEVRDDCARADAGPATYTHAELAAATTDALALFLNEAGRHRLLEPD